MQHQNQWNIEKKRQSKKLPGHGVLIECCTDENSNLGKAAESYEDVTVVRVTEFQDASNSATLFRLGRIPEGLPGVSLHGSLPCTPWSPWTLMSLHTLGQKFKRKLHKERTKSWKLLRGFIKVAEKVLHNGGQVSFEWPWLCVGWLLPELQKFIQTWSLYTVSFDGCAVGVKSSKGKPIKKLWRIITSSPRLYQTFQDKRCKHRRGEHDTAAGKETKSTQSYPMKMFHMMIQSLFSDKTLAPRMGTRPGVKHKQAYDKGRMFLSIAIHVVRIWANQDL